MKEYLVLCMCQETGFKWVTFGDPCGTDIEAKEVARKWKLAHPNLSSVEVVKIIADDTFLKNI